MKFRAESCPIAFTSSLVNPKNIPEEDLLPSRPKCDSVGFLNAV